MASKKTTAQLIANPAWRKKVSDADLKKASPGLYQSRLATRKRATENATLYNPSAMLSGNSLRQAVNAQVDSETRPALNQYSRDIASSRTQGDQLTAGSNSSFDRVAQALAGQIGNAGSLTANSVAAQQGITAAAQKSLSDYTSGLSDGGGTLQSPAGATTGPGDRASQAAATGQAQIAATGATGATQANVVGAGYQGLLQAMAGATQMQKGEAAKQIGDKTLSTVTDLQGKRSDLVQQRGALRSKYTTDLRQQQFNNQAVAQEYGLKQQTLAEKIAADKADQEVAVARVGVDARNADTAAGRLTESQRHNKIQEAIGKQNADANTKRAQHQAITADGKDAFGHTPAQLRSAQNSFTKAQTLASLYDDGKGSEHDLFQLLVSQNVPADMARAAAMQQKRTRVGPKTAQSLRAAGVVAGYKTKGK